jgi:hypothetical protein
MKKRRYFVTGNGSFPDDMLRYDRAELLTVITDRDRKFYLLEGEGPPTVGRWNSFMWSVIDTREKRKYWGLPEVDHD